MLKWTTSAHQCVLEVYQCVHVWMGTIHRCARVHVAESDFVARIRNGELGGEFSGREFSGKQETVTLWDAT